MKIILRIISIALFVGATSNNVFASQFEDADKIMSAFFDASPAPGISVSVGMDDRIIWSKGYGLADVEQKVSVDPGFTKFRIGSVSKPLTAAALVRLVENEKIKLDDTIWQYLPDYPIKKHQFTLRQLAGHLAGIRHYRGNEAYITKHYDSVSEGLEIFNQDALISIPGEVWNYSSYGFNLLSAAMEAAANKPFIELMDEAVFSPLGMNQTAADEISQVIPGRSRYYYMKGESLANEAAVDNSYKWASGGFLSTTNDLVKFGLAHINGSYLSASSKDLLWRQQQTKKGDATGYGIGWRIVTDDTGKLWIGHGGGSIGGTSQFWIFPQEKIVIAITSNLTDLNYGDLLVKLRKSFTDYAARLKHQAK